MPTWTYARGQGALTIDNYAPSNTGYEGVLAFGAGIRPEDVALSRSGDDLVLTVAGVAGDQVTVRQAFLDAQHAIGQVQFQANGSVSAPYFGVELTAALPPGSNGPLALSAIEYITDSQARTEQHAGQSTILHADGVSFALTGAGNTVVLTGANGTVGVTGDHAAVRANGSQDSVAVTGNAASVSMVGQGGSVRLSGNDGAVVLNGNGGLVSAVGRGNAVTAYGLRSAVEVGGADSTVAIANGDVRVADGATGIRVSGAADTVRVGHRADVRVDGDGMQVGLGGQYGSAVLNGNSEVLIDSGAGSTVALNGGSSSVVLSGTAGSATVSGVGNAVSVIGSSYAAVVNGTAARIVLAGSGNALTTGGSAVTVADGAQGATVSGGANAVLVGTGVGVSLTGDGGTLSVTGNNSVARSTGSYGTVSVTGDRNQVAASGAANAVTIAGTGNSVLVLGTAARVQVSGQAQGLSVAGGTVSLADGAQAAVTGYSAPDGSRTPSDGNRFLLGAGASLAVTGGNNYVEVGSGDTVSLNGNGNGVGASGTGNVVTISGTGGGFGQGAYARMDGSTLVLRVGNTAALTGDYDAATVEAGATLHVAGTGDAVTATGATLSFDGPATPALPASRLAVRGFAFPAAAAGNYDPAASAGSLAGLAATGANAVELVTTQFLHDAGHADKDAVTISATDRTESDANLLSEIAAAKSRGLQVLLKPHVDVADGQTWRAQLTPYDPAQFFANYKAFIVHYAQLAQAAGADQFCIGAELQSLSGAAYRSQWLDIIAAVRAAYSGPITYASAAFETGSVSFWDKVDVIGANAYERLSTKDNPTLAELEAGWTQPTPVTNNPIGDGSVQPDPGEPATKTDGFGKVTASDGTVSYYSGSMGAAPAGTTAISPVAFYQGISAQYGKPVLFTEAGYASVNATNKLEGDGRRSATTTVDYQQQALATQAFLDVFTQAKGTWLQGAYLWSWNPNTAGVTADDSSVQDKPALDVVRRYYGAAPASAVGAQSNAVIGDGNAVTLGPNQGVTLSGNGNVVRLSADALAAGTDGLAVTGAGNQLRLGLAGGQQVRVARDAAGNVGLVLPSGAQVLLAGELLGAGHGVDSIAFLNGETWDRTDLSALLNEDGAFDAQYYLAHNPDVAAAGVNPFLHYLRSGWKEERNPGAFFDSRLYLSQNPDVAAMGMNPLLHYEAYGWREGRDPSLLFSGARYLAANPDVKAAGIDPLAHYVAYGQAEGRTAFPTGGTAAADPLVDSAYLGGQLGASLVPAGAAGGQQAAWRYHAAGGWQQGLNPDPYFSTAYYLAHNPDVAAAGIDPLLHYEQYGWKEGRDPSAKFDLRDYLAANPDVKAAGVDPLAHFLGSGQAGGRAAFAVPASAPDPLVDAAYYYARNQDVRAAGLDASAHFQFYGWQEGRNPDAFFDIAYYLAHNPDVAAARINPAAHYEQYGWKEGRNPSAQFSTAKYLAAYGDVRAAGIDPLAHYVSYGQAEGRAVFPA